MANIDFKNQCIKCNSSTINRCITCGMSLCHRCKTRKEFTIPLSNNIIPKGICHDCKRTLLVKGTLKSAAVFQDLIKSLSQQVEI